MTTNNYDSKEGRSANTGLAKVAVQCSADSFVVNQSLVLLINICGANRHLRQARKRWLQYLQIISIWQAIFIGKPTSLLSILNTKLPKPGYETNYNTHSNNRCY
jgi:hypothetical protein